MNHRGFVCICLFSIVLLSASCGQKAGQNSPVQNSENPWQNLGEDVSVLQDAKDGRVYLVSGGKRHYIPDPQTLETLGVRSQIRGVQDEEISVVPLGQPLPTLSSKFIQKAGTGEVFIIEGGKRRHVPDPATFEALHIPKQQLIGVHDAEADAIPLGEPIPHKAKQ